MKSSISCLAGFTLAASGIAVVPPAQAQEPLDAETIRNLNCTLRMTSDYVTDTIMMQDVAASAAECKAICAKFASSSLLSMKDEVKVLRYTCDYRGRIVERRNLK